MLKEFIDMHSDTTRRYLVKENNDPNLINNSDHGEGLMIYGRPVIQALDSVDHFFDRLSRRILHISSNADWRARKITDFIDSRPGQFGWNLADVCKQLRLPMSGRQARRVFRRAMRIGFKEYLKNSRLAFAAEQLKATTTVPIKAIAADAGYQRTAEFARSFKKLFLLRPTEYRKLWHRKESTA